MRKKKINSFSSLHSLIRRVAEGRKVVFPVRLKEDYYSPIKEKSKNMISGFGNVLSSNNNKNRSKTGRKRKLVFNSEYKQNRRKVFDSKENI